jgi:Skp family chaperone for outer membrane proteins
MQSLRAIVLLTFAIFASVLPAQEVAQNPVVTVDLERLVSETQIGQYLSFQMSEEAQSLQAELDAIEAELSAEEEDLIKKRETLDLNEFRVLAKAFDEKAVRLRQEQQAKIQAINEESSRRRQDLLRSFVPVLSQVMRDRGATVLLDRRSVVLDDRASVDITDVAIMIIDQNTTETDAPTNLETPADPSVQE